MTIVVCSVVYEPYKPPAFAQASYQVKKMEDIKNIEELFSQINAIVTTVQSKMAAAPTTQYLPLIADLLSRMEEMVASQAVSQSESGYDTCDAVSDAVSVSSQSSSSSSSVSSFPVSTPAQVNVKHIFSVRVITHNGVYRARKDISLVPL